MAYQNVGTPRFYINDIDYARNLGVSISEITLANGNNLNAYEETLNPYFGEDAPEFNTELYYNIIGTSPSESRTVNLDNPNNRHFVFRFKTIQRDEISPNYVACLNHNLSDSLYGLKHTYRNEEGLESGGKFTESIVNSDTKDVHVLNVDLGEFVAPHFNGFSMFEIEDADDGKNSLHEFRFSIDNENLMESRELLGIGSLWVGRYYDMPHSPELDLTITIENDGYDAITTQGGAHLSNIRYTGAPMWERVDGTKVPPWTIGEPTTPGRRTGRRVWDLQFNYLNDSELFASNYMNTNYMQSGSDTGYDSEDLTSDGNSFYYNLENDNSFHAQVLNRVGNGQRFIFQPDNTNNNPDQFAICQLDQDSLNIKQVANGVYNIKLKIREVW